MMQKLTLGSLFDGIAGFPLAARRQGIKTIWTSEIEPNCIDIAAKHFPDAENLGDITKIRGDEAPAVDIISFGSPCQDLSIAGKQQGLDGSRSGLFMEAVRIIREMRTKTNGEYPKYIIWENVAGAFSSNKGEDFRRVLEEITESNISMPASGKWAPAGMVGIEGAGGAVHSTAWRMFDAQFWGVPQRRKRIYLVRDFGSGRAGQILFECESVLGYYPQSGNQEKGNPDHNESGPIRTDCRGMAEEPDGQITLDFGRTADRIYMNAKKSVTLMGRAGGGGGKTGLYCLPVYTVIGNTIGRKPENGSHQLGIGQDVSPTLTGTDRHAIAYAQSGFAECKEGLGTLTRSHGVSGSGQMLVAVAEKIAQAIKYRVRRLTPLECERLDGFGDNWTEYGASGKKISDNARYMALGNSIAVPCAERVFIGIKKAEAERNLTHEE